MLLLQILILYFIMILLSGTFIDCCDSSRKADKYGISKVLLPIEKN